MKYRIIIVLSFLLITEPAKPQTYFKPGYIIRNLGDTIYGELDYRGDLSMGSICRFKSSVNDITIFNPDDIIAFRFTDSKFYASKEIDGKARFLEFLINGKISIYYLKDPDGDHYYVEKDNESIAEIPFEEGIKYVEDKPYEYASTRHIGFLIYYTQDAPEFQPRIASMKKPGHHNLIRLAEDYHHAVCRNEDCIIYESQNPWLVLLVEPLAGLTKYASLNRWIPEIGGYLYIWAPGTNEHLYFKTGIIYHAISEGEDRLNIFKIPVQLQYMYNGQKFCPKASMGINFLTLKLEEQKGITHTLSMNGGLNYRLTNSVMLSTWFCTDFTPLARTIMFKEEKFGLISFSFQLGVNIVI